ncbi:hypothetical protein ANI_1_630104 [Paecilomyces variotii No. 5]|uniref:Uncharacterized protein n=1 Tax=Byssochlamys spectabilis (strain No. 5 / NBRC 109023) TaxID=1356009 RepID=V5G454_BYSSN|nr:hypothetical protein ANI_1_630104 [Paecilomyces variotii No. 5]
MAFRVPTQAPRRLASYSTSLQPPTLEIPHVPSQQQEDDTREWVLFSPSQAPSTTHTYTNSTERTPRTAGLSRLSDFGSLETATASEADEEDDENDLLEDEATELDSLDDGLHAFREPALSRIPSGGIDQTHAGVLPTHDGLGTFQASSEMVQDQLWQYESFNPRRRPDLLSRRRSSVQRQLDTVNEHDDVDADQERWQRIEKWRMEQSRALLEEIERETKRRRNSRASLYSDRGHSRRSSTMSGIPEARAVSETRSSTEHNTYSERNAVPEESFWRRITRKVIRDLIGIDDSLLSVILGESLPETQQQSHQGKYEESAYPSPEVQTRLEMDRIMMEAGSGSDTTGSWQEKLLNRISHELGILVHQIYEHPGAFSTYLRPSEDASDQYAGMPVNSSAERSSTVRNRAGPKTTSDDSTNFASSTYSPHFSPTLRDATGDAHAALWGIEEENPSDAAEAPATSSDEPLSESVRLQREHEYWERELDVMMVFRYIRNRFGRGNDNNNVNSSARRRANSSLYSAQDPSHRAAIIRQHHPLVARAHARSQTQFQRQIHLHTQSSSGITAPAGTTSPILQHRFRRPSSSCASQSTKVSTKRHLAGLGSGSSRNYWDIGGSVGSGSAVLSTAGIGAWGEV